MYINFRCSECGAVSPVSYGVLYSIWKQGYEQMPDDQKSQAYFNAEIQCICGNKDKFDSPMFQYAFKTIFKEILALDEG